MRRLLLPMLLLALVLGWLQYRLWFGEGSWGEVNGLQNHVAQQKHENHGLQERNNELAAEVEDLKSGEAAVEERARSELGMIKPGEKFYRVVESTSSPAPVNEQTQAGTDAEPQR
ncbi:MAG: cell division protein FtsB [Pseudoxanthomonas sp.]